MPRSKELNQQMRDKRRESILRKSLRLFAYDGYDSLTVDGIADACRCSHGLFYYYFKSKEELFNAVVETYSAKYQSLMMEIRHIEEMHGTAGLKEFCNFVAKLLSEGGEKLLLSRLVEVRRSAYSISEEVRATLKIYDAQDVVARLQREAKEEGTGRSENAEWVTSFFLDWFTGISYRRIRYKGLDFKCPKPEYILKFFVKMTD